MCLNEAALQLRHEKTAAIVQSNSNIGVKEYDRKGLLSFFKRWPNVPPLTNVQREGESWEDDQSTILFTGEAMVRCRVAVEGLRQHARRPDDASFEKITKLDEVAFEMIGDDFNKTVRTCMAMFVTPEYH